MMKRLLDILGAVVGLIICGIVSILLVPIIRRDGGPAILLRNELDRMDAYLHSTSFDRCMLMLRSAKRLAQPKPDARWYV